MEIIGFDGSLLIIRGNDKIKFLNGLTTNNIANLNPKEPLKTVFTQRSAKIIDVVHCIHMNDFIAIAGYRGHLQELLAASGDHLELEVAGVLLVTLATLALLLSLQVHNGLNRHAVVEALGVVEENRNLFLPLCLPGHVALMASSTAVSTRVVAVLPFLVPAARIIPNRIGDMLLEELHEAFVDAVHLEAVLSAGQLWCLCDVALSLREGFGPAPTVI